jgi:hypothetical protein
MRLAVLFASLAASIFMIGCAAAQDRHEGYYYPRVGSSEVYEARVPTLQDSDRRRRLGFVAGLTKQLAELPYPAPYAIFAKGDQAEKMIIVGYRDGMLDTVYRSRALFATMTSLIRLGPLFQGTPIDDQATFFDLAKLLGFEQITVSDGHEFAHRITLQ